jgi:alpha-ribazole phosphatase
VRHPAADVAPGVCYGRLDVAVPDAAALALAGRLAGYGGTIWTSPAQRCRVVVAALARRNPSGLHPTGSSYAPGIASPVVDDRLQELDFGDWEGLAWDDIPRAALDAWAADLSGFAPPGGETGAALVARVTAFAAALPPGDHIVVTHGGPLRILPAILRGEPADLAMPAPPLGSVTLIARAG